MKRAFITILILFLSTGYIFSQANPRVSTNTDPWPDVNYKAPVKPPREATEVLENKFEGLTAVLWYSMENNDNYLAVFELNSQDYEAIVTPSGVATEIGQVWPVEELPEPVIASYQDDYPNQEAIKALKISQPTGENLYKVLLNSEEEDAQVLYYNFRGEGKNKPY